MSSKIKKQGVKPIQTAVVRPGLVRRAGAYMMDWFIGDLFASFPVTIMYAIIYNTAELNNDLTAFPPKYGVMAGLLALLFSLVYFVFLPCKVWSGQTIGKKICGLKIVMTDDKKVEWKALFIRQVLGIFLIESFLVTIGHYLRQVVFIITKADWVMTYPYYAGMGFALISTVLVVFSPSRRALHDRIAGTKVVMVTSIF